MPSVTTSKVQQYDDFSTLTISTTDPRRDGRVDVYMFDVAHTIEIQKRSWVVRSGIPFSNDGINFSKFISTKVGLSLRIEDNEDYTSANYTKRSITEGMLTKANEVTRAIAAKKREIYAKNFHPRQKWKSKEDIVELPIIIQNDEVITIKCNVFFQYLIPKYAILMRNGLYLRSQREDRPYGKALSAHIMDSLSLPKSGAKQHRKDRLDYRIDPSDMRWMSCNINKTKYYTFGAVSVLEIVFYDPISPWFVQNRHMICENPLSDERAIYICFDSCVLQKILDGEYEWSYKSVTDGIEIISPVTETSTISLKRILARLYGMDIGAYRIESRFSKYYAKAIETNDLSRRAKLENTINSEKGRGKVLYTKAVERQYRNLFTEKEFFVEDMFGGIGQWCLDMRNGSIRVSSNQSE